MKPLIGITCNYDPRDVVGTASGLGLVGQKWHFTADNYIAAIEEAGGLPVLIPTCEHFETVREMLDQMDGFLITGGHDVYPPAYGERVSGTCGILSPKRDRQDIAVVQYILESGDKPLLGICRGIQVMNVAGGGTLYQDLERDAGALRHDLTMGPINEPVHRVELEPDSLLHRIYGTRTLHVNSFHHQSVRRTAEGYRESARSEDGVIEAVEKIGSRFVVGVQWHPEMMYDSQEQKKLFQYFIGSC